MFFMIGSGGFADDLARLQRAYSSIVRAYIVSLEERAAAVEAVSRCAAKIAEAERRGKTRKQGKGTGYVV